jgi:hypothetical protein
LPLPPSLVCFQSSCPLCCVLLCPSHHLGPWRLMYQRYLVSGDTGSETSNILSAKAGRALDNTSLLQQPEQSLVFICWFCHLLLCLKCLSDLRVLLMESLGSFKCWVISFQNRYNWLLLLFLSFFISFFALLFLLKI